jgi:hypothetical protein
MFCVGPSISRYVRIILHGRPREFLIPGAQPQSEMHFVLTVSIHCWRLPLHPKGKIYAGDHLLCENRLVVRGR